MNRSTNANAVWNYLPAFCAVAETQHLPSAAVRLHVVPSALSRTIRLLEQAIGEELFTRRGGRIFLNARGQTLLEVVRSGMTGIERGLTRAAGTSPLEGEVAIGTIGVLTNHVVLPVLLDLVRDRPALVPVMRNCSAKEANHRLMIGALDVAFYYEALPLEGVHCSRLGTLTSSVYCGRGHPLFGARAITKKQVLAHPFSVPGVGDRHTPMDGWPIEVERHIGFQIELLLTNLEVCLSGRFVTVLPDVVAEPHVTARRLQKVPCVPLPEIEVYGACREGDLEEPLANGLFRGVRGRLAAVGKATP